MIINEILTMNYEQLDEVLEAVKYRRNQLARQNLRQLCVGDPVTFKSRTSEVYGVVTKINRKTVIVDEGATRWKVPASLVSCV